MTSDREDKLAERLLGIDTAPLVIADAQMGAGWVSDAEAAAELAYGAGLPVLTESELAMAARIAAVLGGYSRL